MSAITVVELYEGIQRSQASEAERRAVETLLSEVNELPSDRAAATKAGAITATLADAGQPIDETDVVIAATALVNGLPVVTRNLEHFERIDDLAVRSY